MNKLRKPVRCIETGVVYGSIKEAADAVNGADILISKVCRGLAKTHKKLHWEFVL